MRPRRRREGRQGQLCRREPAGAGIAGEGAPQEIGTTDRLAEVKHANRPAFSVHSSGLGSDQIHGPPGRGESGWLPRRLPIGEFRGGPGGVNFRVRLRHGRGPRGPAFRTSVRGTRRNSRGQDQAGRQPFTFHRKRLFRQSQISAVAAPSQRLERCPTSRGYHRCETPRRSEELARSVRTARHEPQA